MIRDFSEEKKEELILLIREMNLPQDNFLSELVRMISGNLSKIFRRMISFNPDAVISYEQSVIRENQFLEGQIETIFNDVKELDTLYMLKFDLSLSEGMYLKSSLLSLTEMLSKKNFSLNHKVYMEKLSQIENGIRKSDFTVNEHVEKLLDLLFDAIPTLQVNKKYEFQVSKDLRLYFELEGKELKGNQDVTIKMNLDDMKTVFKKLTVSGKYLDRFSIKNDYTDQIGTSISASSGDMKFQINDKGELEFSDKLSVDERIVTVKTIITLLTVTEEFSLESKDENADFTVKLGVTKEWSNDVKKSGKERKRKVFHDEVVYLEKDREKLIIERNSVKEFFFVPDWAYYFLKLLEFQKVVN